MAAIEEVFFISPMAIARLGASDSPMDSFVWAEDPSLHGAGRTVIAPALTLELLQDGSVRPFMPSTIQFRDGAGLRPVAPFFELWARVQGSDVPQPLTTELLSDSDNRAALQNVAFTVTAANRKAARRTGDGGCAFSARITVAGDDHVRKPLLASSAGPRPLVSPERPIPLGFFQVIRPTPGASEMNVKLDVLRVRYTPARGEVYGPRSAVRATDPETGRTFDVVPDANRILNEDSAWTSYNADARFDSPEPADTYDGADDDSRGNLSMGVVDDTCDVLIEAAVVVGGRRRLVAHARVFCGPPDFAPDRRPFASLAEELIDRDPVANQSPEPLRDAVERLGDLFQRVYETASLANLDAMRDRALTGQPASQFPPATTLKDSMTPADPLFDKTENLNSRPSTHERLPYASVAQSVHAPLADVEDLALFLRGNSDKVKRIVRPPFGAFSELKPSIKSGDAPNAEHRDPRNDRDNLFDMRMPPYMRDADASPLSISRRQYRLLLDVINGLRTSEAAPTKALKAAKAAAPGATAAPASRVREHVQRVAKRLRGE